jgi:hypothetical protein
MTSIFIIICGILIAAKWTAQMTLEWLNQQPTPHPSGTGSGPGAIGRSVARLEHFHENCSRIEAKQLEATD